MNTNKIIVKIHEKSLVYLLNIVKSCQFHEVHVSFMLILFLGTQEGTTDFGPVKIINLQELFGSRFPASNFVLLIVPSRYFCGGSFCFMSWCLKYICAVGALCMFAYF